MRTFVLIFFPVLLLAMVPGKQKQESKGSSYDSLKTEVMKRRNELRGKYSTLDPAGRRELIKITENYLYKVITDSIIPKWYGTNWAFSGISEKPGEGSIACGYFVSTVLRDAGFNLNRYKLAQQPSAWIVKTFSGETIYKKYKPSEVLRLAPQLRNGLYVLGLDYHVGFLLKMEEDLYFIHSSYLNPKIVRKEKFEESEVIQLSDIFIFTELLTDINLEKWLKEEKIKIIDQ